jgi:hypothetical protein
VQRPTLVMAPNKTLRRAAGQRVPRAAAEQRGRVLRLLLRLLPARGVRPADGHLHREGLLDQRGGRAAAPLGDASRCSPAATSSSSRPSPASTASARRRSTSTAGPLQVGQEIERDQLLRTLRHEQYTRNDLPSPAARSGSAATRSRSSRSTRSSPSGSRCSATRSSGSTTCTRSPAR